MFHATTILCIKKDDHVAMIGDGQVTLGATVAKGSACKVRSMRSGKVLAGFAGSSADAFTLFERFETKLEEYRGNLTRAAVELAKDWRMDKFLRKLEAMMIVADNDKIFTISGTGDILEPDDNIASIGSGGVYALAAAKALSMHTQLSAEDIARESMKIAGDICIYTNQNHHIELI